MSFKNNWLSRAGVLFFGMMISGLACSQAGTVIPINAIKAPDSLDNIHVHPLATDKHSSQFIIFVKKHVKTHIHRSHSESVYILEGEGDFVLGRERFSVKPGDFVYIPANTVHGVQVTSETPMKVMSVQAPEFTGVDRIFVDVN